MCFSTAKMEEKFVAKVFVSSVTIVSFLTLLRFMNFKSISSKKALPGVKTIYFSDGARRQYKNKKNFVNMCQHENDIGLVAEWNFFATSHGKNSCDGIGGTTKREVTRASMQRPYNDKILTPEDMYKFCTE
jgi:hypothetical protein